MMHKAIEYEVKYDRKGRPIERRWSIGPILVTTFGTLVLALTGHTLWNGIVTFVKAVKWW